MARSKEYPDLSWVEPRSWTNANRSSVQLVVIHTTEGSSTAESAENGAAYDARRTDGVSTHYFHDSNSTVQCVLTADQAHAARREGNRRGIHHEFCARAGWDDARWQGDYAQDMLRVAAKQAARDSRKWNIPVRHLTAAEVRAGVKGFCAHWDITRAFPDDLGDHTDPGDDFPWSQFLDMVRDELAPDTEDDDMDQATFNKLMNGYLDTTDGKKKLLQAIMYTDGVVSSPPGADLKNPDGSANNQVSLNDWLFRLYRELGWTKDAVGDVQDSVDALAPVTPPPVPSAGN